MFSYSLFNLLWTKTEVSLNVFIGNIIITFLVWLKNNNSCHLTTLLQHDCPGTMFIPNLYIYYKTIAFYSIIRKNLYNQQFYILNNDHSMFNWRAPGYKTKSIYVFRPSAYVFPFYFINTAAKNYGGMQFVFDQK